MSVNPEGNENNGTNSISSGWYEWAVTTVSTGLEKAKPLINTGLEKANQLTSSLRGSISLISQNEATKDEPLISTPKNEVATQEVDEEQLKTAYGQPYRDNDEIYENLPVPGDKKATLPPPPVDSPNAQSSARRSANW